MRGAVAPAATLAEIARLTPRDGWTRWYRVAGHPHVRVRVDVRTGPEGRRRAIRTEFHREPPRVRHGR